MQSVLAKNIFYAAREGDTDAIFRLLPNATAEELNYEEKVCIFRVDYISCVIFLAITFQITFDLSLFCCLAENSLCSKTLSHI